MKRLAWPLLAVAILILAGVFVWRVSMWPGSGAGSSFKNGRQHGMTLKMASVTRQSLPLYLSAQGQVVPEHSVAIQPQVSGLLEQVHFTEGSHVKKGQLLFQIAPAPFEAQLLGAKAAWQDARTNADRTKTLLAKHYVTEQAWQDAQAAAEKARADYQTAQINLGYTRITAPITGLTGLLSVKSGNLVTPSDSKPLVTINQMQPIDVQFSLPQENLSTIRQHMASTTEGKSLTVVVTSGNRGGLLAQGKLIFLGNQVDSATGTFVLKARFSNANEALWPGQFVTVKLELALQQVLTIPASALQTGQDGDFVYQLEDGKTVATNVVLDREQGKLAIITSGLEEGQSVVVQVPRNLRVGIPAKAQSSEETDQPRAKPVTETGKPAS